MMDIVTVIGARPQFIKAAVFSRAVAQSPDFSESIIHTGQHFDEKMSNVFFKQLGIPEPELMLKCHSSSHGQMTADMIVGIETELMDRRPDLVLVYGDTNSTLAAGLAAVKLGIPIAHVEAGVRSYNRSMPEEVNRVIIDTISHYLFCPTEVAVENLCKEGIVDGVEMVGDIMYESYLHYSQQLEKIEVSSEFCLFTCHRPSNTNSIESLEKIVGIINRISDDVRVVFPLHPRIRIALNDTGLISKLTKDNIDLIDPVPYFEIIQMLEACKYVVTDSGGLQKEAFFAGKYCLTMREDTEWVETVEAGVNFLTGNKLHLIEEALLTMSERRYILNAHPSDFYGDGDTSSKIMINLKLKR